MWSKFSQLCVFKYNHVQKTHNNVLLLSCENFVTQIFFLESFFHSNWTIAQADWKKSNFTSLKSEMQGFYVQQPASHLHYSRWCPIVPNESS